MEISVSAHSNNNQIDSRWDPNMSNTSNQPRWPKAYMSAFGTNSLHLRNPWVIACWSMTFPGFGHLLLHKYMRGYLLILWEILINNTSQVNLALYYSFHGEFETAKQIINLRWYLLYSAGYIFAIWDSYRTTVDANKLSLLADLEGTKIDCFKMSVLEFEYLDKRKPWNSVVWSLLMPGLGHILIHRIPLAFFILIWWIIISYYSHFIEALHFTFLGDFQQAAAVLVPQWALFLPSLYWFSIYDAYANTVEYNKLFKKEQSQFLNQQFQISSIQSIIKKR
jgi:hypothetical protein